MFNMLLSILQSNLKKTEKEQRMYISLIVFSPLRVQREARDATPSNPSGYPHNRTCSHSLWFWNVLFHSRSIMSVQLGFS